MKRRQLIKASITSGVIIGIGGGIFWSIEGSNPEDITIDAALTRLDVLAHSDLVNTGAWNPHQIFSHCAQSVEYSMTGFPLHKSYLFKNTIGQLAFSMFSSKGRMTHDLSDPIPGAPSLVSENDTILALDRLKESLVEFLEYKGKFAPHFAYGELTKQEYEIAHVMHLYNHLQEIEGNKLS